jgi:hypothetical protein
MFRVQSPLPVNHEHDLAACVIDVDNDLANEHAHELLPNARWGGWRRPGVL